MLEQVTPSNDVREVLNCYPIDIDIISLKKDHITVVLIENIFLWCLKLRPFLHWLNIN